jgi:carbamoylphosphate synthase small subunit
MNQQVKEAILLLEDGTLFKGKAFGKLGTSVEKFVLILE